MSDGKHFWRLLDRTFDALLNYEAQQSKNTADQLVIQIDKCIGNPRNGILAEEGQIERAYLNGLKASALTFLEGGATKDLHEIYCVSARTLQTNMLSKLTELHSGNIEPSKTENLLGDAALNTDEVSLLKSFQLGSEWPEIYVLGCFDLKKTFYTQQKRSVALATLLSRVGRIKPTTTVAVVGAGLGGMTVASMLAHFGANVRVFEKQGTCGPAQITSSRRFVHPNILDWPNESFKESQTKLPYLNWSAAYASIVLEKVSSEFGSLCGKPHSTGGMIELSLNSEIKSLDRVAGGSTVKGGIRLLGNSPSTMHTAEIVILAIGFGPELDLGPHTKPYWETEDLERCAGFTVESREKIVVSGVGDGGLTDVLRAAIRGFRHDNILTMFPWFESQKFLKEAIAIEQEAKTQEVAFPNDQFDFFNRYEELFKEFPGKAEIEELRIREREITVCYRNWNVYSAKASMLNRLAVHAIYSAGLIEFRRGTIQATDLEPTIVDGKQGYHVRLNSTTSKFYHRAILRNGFDKNMVVNLFPNLKSSLEKLQFLNESRPIGDRLVESVLQSLTPQRSVNAVIGS
jgi:NAD(P)-binding Rossmann-like domain